MKTSFINSGSIKTSSLPINPIKTHGLTVCMLLLGVLLISHLAGCQSKPTASGPVTRVQPTEPQDPTSLLQKANQASSPEREELMLQAASLYLQHKQQNKEQPNKDPQNQDLQNKNQDLDLQYKNQDRAGRILTWLGQQKLSAAQLATQQKLSLKLKQLLIQRQIDQTKNQAATAFPENTNRVIKIGVLLAESGRLKPASDAIRQGILLAYYQQAQLGMTAELLFFDTATSQAAAVYQQAVAAGANLIIGPLDKDQVKQLAALPTLSVPVLALNYLPESTPVASAQLFQFGLAVEDEAKTISHRAQQMGFRRASLLYPKNEWGERSAAAFRQAWQQQDGILVSERSYGTQAGTDYSGPVHSLLGVHKSVDADGKSKQSRRQDIDFVVMISDASAARQLKPMLDYYFADNLPIFSTFNIFNTVADPGKDQDINGVQFTELPWLLKENNALKRDYLRQHSAVNTSNAANAETLRLVALGIDSFQLAPRLGWLQQNTTHQLEGATGTLSLNASRRIQRQSTWAKFTDGSPSLLNTKPVATYPDDHINTEDHINTDNLDTDNLDTDNLDTDKNLDTDNNINLDNNIDPDLDSNTRFDNGRLMRADATARQTQPITSRQRIQPAMVIADAQNDDAVADFSADAFSEAYSQDNSQEDSSEHDANSAASDLNNEILIPEAPAPETSAPEVGAEPAFPETETQNPMSPNEPNDADNMDSPMDTGTDDMIDADTSVESDLSPE